MAAKDFTLSNEEFIKIVQNSSNISEALKKMKLVPQGANYKFFRKKCAALNINPPTTNSPNIDPNNKIIKNNIKDSEIIWACQNNLSLASTLKSFNLNPHWGSNRSWLKSKIQHLKVNTSHWTGQGHLKNKTHDWSQKTPLSEILVANSSYTNNNTLKKRIIKELGWKYKCFSCGINSWMNQKISLHLDHINGINNDNRIENLRLLCPNCHSLTPTYCGKNKKSS